MAEKKPLPEETPTEPVKKRLQFWQKFPIDAESAEMARAMLDLEPDDELPEALWIILGIHKAMERRFMVRPFTQREMAAMIIETQFVLPSLRSHTKYVPGERVFVKSLNREAFYWHVGPCNKHLVNCYGDVFLVNCRDIEATEAATTNSTLNKDAAVGAQLRRATEGILPKDAKERVPAAVV
ncbi:MAG: hypothetical protein ACYCQK_01440 [Acidiferrobacteraceae bacterium]